MTKTKTKTIEVTETSAAADSFTADQWGERVAELDRELVGVIAEKELITEQLASTTTWADIEDKIDSLAVIAGDLERLHQLRTIAQNRGVAAMTQEAAVKKANDLEKAVPIFAQARATAARIDGLLAAIALEFQSLRDAAQELSGLGQPAGPTKAFLRSSTAANSALTAAGLDEFFVYPRIHGRSLESNFDPGRQKIQSPPPIVHLEPKPIEAMKPAVPVRRVAESFVQRQAEQQKQYSDGLGGELEQPSAPFAS